MIGYIIFRIYALKHKTKYWYPIKIRDFRKK